MAMAEPEAAVAIVRAREPRESILLIRRSERKEDSWSGHWSFPGGRRESGDPDLLHTALRELEEECGIRLDRAHLEAELPPVLARRRTMPFVLVAPFVFSVEGELPTVVDPREAVEAVWHPQSVWCDPAQHSLRAVPGLPADWLFPAIDLNGVPVWGFTYRLATDWLRLLPGQGPIEGHGFAIACSMLDLLRSHGLRLKRGWEDRMVQPSALQPGMARPGIADGQASKVATVEGIIPVELVSARFAAPGRLFPCINFIEIRPEYIRVVGLAFEEYLILAA
jgi:8-oxo-dGTP pyrophosphatase MutT (NUDIX family)